MYTKFHDISHSRMYDLTSPSSTTFSVDPVPWWKIAGFASADDMPSVPKVSAERKCLSKLHTEEEDDKQLQALMMMTEEVEQINRRLKVLDFKCDTYAKWLNEAENRIKQKGWKLEVS